MFLPILLDIVPPDADGPARNRIAAAGLEAAVKSKPAAFFKPSLARLVTIGNFEDDLQKLAEVDWIIEAVVEDLEIKRSLLRKIEAIRKPGTIITTNTSGLPVAKIVEGFPDDFRRYWFGTHFFNPPRYMRLLELIPTPDADPAAMDAIAHFCDLHLGKGVVHAKDTPNFIANRIGTFCIAECHAPDAGDGPQHRGSGCADRNGRRLAQDGDLPPRRSGWARCSGTRGAQCHHQHPRRAQRPHAAQLLPQMLERKWLGDKTKGGFYRKSKKADGETEIMALDWKTLEYRPSQRPKFPALEMAKTVDSLPERLQHAAGAVERQGQHLPLVGFVGPVDLCREPHWRDCRLGGRDRSRHEAGLQLGDGAVRAVGRRRRCQDRQADAGRGQTGFAQRREAAGFGPGAAGMPTIPRPPADALISISAAVTTSRRKFLRACGRLRSRRSRAWW